MIILKIMLVLIITIAASYTLFQNISSQQAQSSTKNQRIGKIGLSLLTLILLIIIIINESFNQADTISNNNYREQENTEPTTTITHESSPNSDND